jgi:hypothetical protein
VLSKAVAALALAASLTCALPLPGSAAIETDPAVLYATMKRAYDEGASRGWPFESELYYQATIFDAGRAYALFRPEDPNYAEVATLAVDIASQLHYSPLTNNDASLWYITEAANYVIKNSDQTHQIEARVLLDRLTASETDPKLLAQQTIEDAAANAATFHHDGDALVSLLIADVRALNLTHDLTYRSDLLLHMTDPSTPLTRVPDPEYGEMFAIASSALTDPGYSDTDRANARAIKYRRDHTPELHEIARVTSTPHDLRLTRTAPADEYFGNLKYSPLGVRNEVTRVDKYLDRGWGYRMESDALQIDSSVEDWQKQYPHDLTLPANLLDTYVMLERVGTEKTKAAAARVKTTLLVEYPSARQALELSSNG